MSETDRDLDGSAEELERLVDQLNALTDEWRQWKWTRARKEHEDLFGQTIRPGDEYLKRAYGAEFHEDVKLSRQSMSKMLHALFDGNLRLQTIAEHLHQEIEKDREQVMRNAVNSIRPPLSPDV